MTKDEENRLNRLTEEEIVAALLKHDSTVSNWFFYKKCYPLFKAIFLKFRPSFEQHGVMIEDTLDFTHEIYSYIMMPRDMKEKGHEKTCRLETFGFECSLFSWLKVVTMRYCLGLIKNKLEFEVLEKTNSEGDVFFPNEPSTSMDEFNLAFNDLMTVINMVHLPRSRQILYMHYIEKLSSEEAATRLGISRAAYDNALSRAKKEFNELKDTHLK